MFNQETEITAFPLSKRCANVRRKNECLYVITLGRMYSADDQGNLVETGPKLNKMIGSSFIWFVEKKCANDRK